jgi:hypothetical protein
VEYSEISLVFERLEERKEKRVAPSKSLTLSFRIGKSALNAFGNYHSRNWERFKVKSFHWRKKERQLFYLGLPFFKF